ncbi:MAG: leucine-rich repeat domain-containing protein, partial [Clostridia bacterium]|nr:leucine-rich repeat domain-containing protein [Clostridia bacterium]
MKNKNRNIIKIFTFSIILISMLLILISCNNNADNSNNNQELEIKSISIDESTIPEFAYVGKLSISSIQLIILYINDETETINLEESFIDFPSQVLLNNEGQHTINVSYKGKTTQFNIEMRLESTQVFKLTIHNGYVISVNGNPYSGNGYKDKIFIDDFSSGSELKLKWDSDDNYDFFGWSTSNYNSDEASIFDKNITVTINLSQSKTIYALMTTKQYTATFNTNFSSIPNFSIKKNVFNSEEEIAKELSYDNYYFYGWTTEPISTAEAISGTYTNIISFPYVLSDDTTFFAVWYPLGLSFSSYIYYENSAKYSGYQVASYNGKLTNLNIPRQYKGEDVISISRDAFNSAESKLLQKISVPDTVVEIQDGAFSNCSSLKYIDVDASNLRFTSEMGVLYKLDKNILVSYPANKVTNIYEIESNCVNISQYAFYDAIIGTIILPEKVANIYDYAFNSPNIDYIDFSALNFSSLNIINDDIKSIFNNNINNIYVSENDITIAKLNLSNKYMLNSDNIVTSDETNLSKIFKSKVGEYDFIYRLIRNEYFDVSNTSIEIIGCDRTIDSIVIPDSIENYFVTSIGNSAFKDSINLNNVVLNNSLERILDDAFYNTLWIETIENNSIVNNGILYKYIGSNKEYKLGYDITKIAESAFRNNKNLEIIDLSNNNQLKNICAYAFYNCSNLDTFDNYLQNSTRGAVYIKDDLIKIDAYAFYNTKIKEIFNYNNSNSQ